MENRERALTELLAREEIRELVHRYSFAADSKDFDAVAELFDPEVDNGRFGKGREATKAFYAQLLGGMGDGQVMHLVANLQIDFVDDSHAYGMCYVRAVSMHDDQCSEAIACYVDDYVRRDGHWYFGRRRPADLQRVRMGAPLGTGKLTLGDAWALHRQRQAELRQGSVRPGID